MSWYSVETPGRVNRVRGSAEDVEVLRDRIKNYLQEVDAIDRRLGSGVSLGKRDKLFYRRKDVVERLIPRAKERLIDLM